MRATFTLCDPQALGNRLIGSDVAGVDKLDRNGRPHNRPVPRVRCSKSGCDDGTYTQDPDALWAMQAQSAHSEHSAKPIHLLIWLRPKKVMSKNSSDSEWVRSNHEHHAKRDPSAQGTSYVGPQSVRSSLAISLESSKDRSI